MDPCIIVGSGLAGYNTARELRKINRDIPLVLVTRDGGEYYSKPMISNALAANKPPQALPLNSAPQMAEQLGATIRTRTEVTAIDTTRQELSIGDETLKYGSLVLAVGAAQIRLPLGGNAAGRVLTVNSLDDYGRFCEALAGKRRIAVIGAGLIGCEFANDLVASGRHVDVIDLAGQPLPRLLPAEGGAHLQEKLAALGVVWHLGTSVAAIEEAGAALNVELANRTVLETDVVLSAVGLNPQRALAERAGIKVNRGIVVNRYLETSAPHVYALGDCAEVEGLVLPFVMPIMHGARALGATLAGRRTALAYPAMPVLVKTPACPTIVAPPLNGAAGAWTIERTADGVKALYVDADGTLLGFALNGVATSARAQLAKSLPPVLS